MKNKINKRNASFTKLIELTKNREHDFFGVPLNVMLTLSLQMIKERGIDAGTHQLGITATKVNMYDQLEEILDYVAHNIDAAIEETMEHFTLNW